MKENTMERIQKIDSMLSSGKISEEQARLLKNALKTSEEQKGAFQKPHDGNPGHVKGLVFITTFFMFFIIMVAGATLYSTKALNNSGENIASSPAVSAPEEIDNRRPVTQTDNNLRSEKRQLRNKVTAVAFLGIVSLVFLLAFCFMTILSYNGIVKIQEDVIENWHGIHVNVKRKLSLMPALLDILSQASVHEQDVVETISQSRQSALMLLDQGDAEIEDLSSVMHKSDEITKGLQVMVESYPDLKSNEAFMFLMSALVESENSIAGQQHLYNSKLKIFHKKTRRFPGCFLSGFFKTNDYSYVGIVE